MTATSIVPAPGHRRLRRTNGADPLRPVEALDRHLLEGSARGDAPRIRTVRGAVTESWGFELLLGNSAHVGERAVVHG